MKKILAGTILALGFSGQALAADIDARTYTKAPAVEAVYNWSGFYAGASAGYGWKDPTVTLSPNDQFSSTLAAGIPPASFNISGAFGGFQAGYNQQFNSGWLLGLETDFNFSNIKGNGASSTVAIGSAFSSIVNEHVDWFGTVRGRLGYVVSPNLLFYGTGGFAYGRVRQQTSYHDNEGGVTVLDFSGPSVTDVGCPSRSDCYVGASTRLATGWTLGGGLEYAIWSHWTAKLEYQYVNLGSNNFQQSAIIFDGPPSTISTHYSDTAFHTVRAGLNYHF